MIKLDQHPNILVSVVIVIVFLWMQYKAVQMGILFLPMYYIQAMGVILVLRVVLFPHLRDDTQKRDDSGPISVSQQGPGGKDDVEDRLHPKPQVCLANDDQGESQKTKESFFFSSTTETEKMERNSCWASSLFRSKSDSNIKKKPSSHDEPAATNIIRSTTNTLKIHIVQPNKFMMTTPTCSPGCSSPLSVRSLPLSPHSHSGLLTPPSSASSSLSSVCSVAFEEVSDIVDTVELRLKLRKEARLERRRSSFQRHWNHVCSKLRFKKGHPVHPVCDVDVEKTTSTTYQTDIRSGHS